MDTFPKGIDAFLLRAKRATYAGNGPRCAPSRPDSRDYRYEEADGGWLYVDTYVGGERFAGEEAVWKDGAAVYAMNYIGRVTAEGFSGEFLKAALLRAPADAPYRGPIEYREGNRLYCNALSGKPDWFFGREEIFENGVSVYECLYQGGLIR